MSTLTNDNITALRATKNGVEWYAACDAIKKEHGGYPEDWWPRMKLSGEMDRIMESWSIPGSTEIRVSEIHASKAR